MRRRSTLALDPVFITRAIEAMPFPSVPNVVISYPHREDWWYRHPALHRAGSRNRSIDEFELLYQRVGWVERSDTHHLHKMQLMGIASLNPSYVLNLYWSFASLHTRPRVQRASGRSPRPLWAENSSNASGAARREVVNVCLKLDRRHCEPTGRANARPMTGSAKQSILSFFCRNGLLRRIRLRPKAGFGGQECSSQ